MNSGGGINSAFKRCSPRCERGGRFIAKSHAKIRERIWFFQGGADVDKRVEEIQPTSFLRRPFGS